MRTVLVRAARRRARALGIMAELGLTERWAKVGKPIARSSTAGCAAWRGFTIGQPSIR